MPLPEVADIKVDAKLLAREVSSLAVATDVRPPLFSGKAGENVTAWVRRFEAVSKALEWDTARMLSQVGVYLMLFAESWYAKITKDGDTPFTTWKLFKEAITARFQAEDFKAQLKRQLNLRKLGKEEALEDYYNDILTLCDQYDREMNDGDIIEMLRNGLSAEVMSRVCISHAKTPMQFLSDMQKALVSIRKENRIKQDKEKGQTFSAYSGGNQQKNGSFYDRGDWKAGSQKVYNGNSNYNQGNRTGMDSQGSQGTSAETKGSGNHGGTGRAGSSGNSGKQNGAPRSADRPPITCYSCGGPHVQRNCPKNKPIEGNQLRMMSVVSEPDAMMSCLNVSVSGDRSRDGGSESVSGTVSNNSGDCVVPSGGLPGQLRTNIAKPVSYENISNDDQGIVIVCGKEVVPTYEHITPPNSPVVQIAGYHYGDYSPTSPLRIDARELGGGETVQVQNSNKLVPSGPDPERPVICLNSEKSAVKHQLHCGVMVMDNVELTTSGGETERVGNVVEASSTSGRNNVPVAAGDMVPLAISRNVPYFKMKLNGRDAIALADSGASFSVVNLSFVRGLGVQTKPHVIEAQLADNRFVRTTGLVELLVEVSGFTGTVPFCIFEDIGSSGRHDAVLGCNLLGVPGLLLDVANNRLVGTKEMPPSAYVTELVQKERETWGSSLSLKSVAVQLLQQQAVGGLVKKHRMLLLSLEEGDDLDLSSWDYSWSPVPVDTYDFCDEVTESGRAATRALLVKYGDLFHTDGRAMGAAKVRPFEIKLVPGAKPKFRNQYRHSPQENEFINMKTDDMLEKRVIRNSNSEWSSPIHLVKKPPKEVRLCADVRGVNEVTVADRHPLPRIDDCLQTLAGKSYFSALDLQSGYWQIPLAEESKRITAFQAGNKFYEYNVLCFGLRNAPSFFQRVMCEVLSGLLWVDVFCYIDDVVIATSGTLEDHLRKLEEIFQRLDRYGLILKPSKCHFVKSWIKVLGFIASRDGIEADGEKVEAVRQFPRPNTLKHTRSFLGLCGYYRRFIKDFATIAGPLHRLSKKDVPFAWGAAEEDAFQRLKDAMTKAPVLVHFNVDLPVEIHPDASGHAMGVVLIQRDENNLERVIAYGSASLSQAQRNYSTTQRECLAIVWTCEKYRYYLLGREVICWSDHHSLCWLFNVHSPNSLLVRWALRLQEYTLKIIHKSGKTHADGDCLSRYPVPIPEPGSHQLRVLESGTTRLEGVDIVKEQQKDAWIRETIANMPVVKSLRKVYFLDEGILYRRWKMHGEIVVLLVIPKHLRLEVMGMCHDDPTSGHLAFARTWDRIRKRFFWPGSIDFAQRYVQSCPACLARNQPTTRPAGPVQSFCPEKPFEIIAMDVMGPLPRTKAGNMFIVTATDLFTKWIVAKALPAQNALAIAKFLLYDIILKYSMPMRILTDHGTPFVNAFTTELYRLMDIKRVTTTPYRPTTNGCCERFNKTLAHMLSKYVDEEQRTWDEPLQFVVFGANTSEHDTTGGSAFKMLYGREPTLPVDVALPTVSQPFNQDVEKRMKDMHVAAQARIERRQNYVYATDDHPEVEYEPGQFVLVFNPAGKRGRATKLLSRFYGPYRIIRKTSPVNYEVETSGQRRKRTFVTHVSKIKLFHDRNEMYVDSEDEEGEGWIPFARAKKNGSNPVGEEPKVNAPEPDSEPLRETPVIPLEGEEEDHDRTVYHDPETDDGDESTAERDEAVEEPAQPDPQSFLPDGEGPTVRQSKRINKGVPPQRLVEEMTSLKSLSENGVVRPGLFKNTPVLAMMVLLVVLPVGLGLKVDVCDCSKPQYGGIISFEKFKNCAVAQNTPRHKQVKYELLMEESAGKTFHGHVCRVWEKVKIINEGVLWNTDTTFQENHKALSPAECWAMVQTSKCGDGTMVKSGNVWSYNAEPKGEGSWNSISYFRVLNCEMEDVTLEQECNSCPVHTVTGELAANRKTGFSVQGQRTYVWGQVGAMQKPCEITRMEHRSGQLFNDSGIPRLRDPVYQMDFILGSRYNTCEPGQSDVFLVEGEPGVGIRIVEVLSRRRRAIISTAIGGKAPVLSLQQYLPEHLQYIVDTTVEHENQLTDALNALDCRTSKDRLNQLYSLSKVSGILAARTLKLDRCQSLESFGTSGVVRQCQQIQVNFTVDNSSRCGPQPRSGKFGISTDGFLLVPYSECLWKSAIVNFNGIPYEARNGEWISVRSTKLTNHQTLIAHFKRPVDMSGSLLSAAMEKEHSLTFNLLSQLSGTMEQHGVENVGRLVESVEKVGQIPEIFARLTVIKTTACVVVGIILATGVAYGVWRWYVPLCGCLRRVRSRAQRKREAVVSGTSAAESSGSGGPVPLLSGELMETKGNVIHLYPDSVSYAKENADLRVVGSYQLDGADSSGRRV